MEKTLCKFDNKRRVYICNAETWCEQKNKCQYSIMSRSRKFCIHYTGLGWCDNVYARPSEK